MFVDLLSSKIMFATVGTEDDFWDVEEDDERIRLFISFSWRSEVTPNGMDDDNERKVAVGRKIWSGLDVDEDDDDTAAAIDTAAEAAAVDEGGVLIVELL